MKTRKAFLTISIFLFCAGILFTSCKKKTETPDPIVPVVPVFSITAVTVQLQAGGEGLQFTAKCTNTDVKMTNVNIDDPSPEPVFPYDLLETSFAKNAPFGLQETNTAYGKQTGIWSFTFNGHRTSDGASFSVVTTFTQAK
jgi:hypothetical protein